MRARLAALLGTDLTMESADRGTDEAVLVELNPIPATNGCDGRIVSADALWGCGGEPGRSGLS